VRPLFLDTVPASSTRQQRPPPVTVAIATILGVPTVFWLLTSPTLCVVTAHKQAVTLVQTASHQSGRNDHKFGLAQGWTVWLRELDLPVLVPQFAAHRFHVRCFDLSSLCKQAHYSGTRGVACG
jgi:hypothetical protein